MKLPVRKSAILDFIWVDGRGHRQKMARRLALQALHTSAKTIDGMVFVRASFSQNQLVLAAQIFRLIGRKPTTVINIRGVATVSKSALERTLYCYESSCRSRAKNYCQTEIVETRLRNSMEIGINVLSFGISTTAGKVPKRRKEKPLMHPCKLCYGWTFEPRPDTREKWIRSFGEVADEMHAIICPRLKLP